MHRLRQNHSLAVGSTHILVVFFCFDTFIFISLNYGSCSITFLIVARQLQLRLGRLSVVWIEDYTVGWNDGDGFLVLKPLHFGRGFTSID